MEQARIHELGHQLAELIRREQALTQELAAVARRKAELIEELKADAYVSPLGERGGRTPSVGVLPSRHVWRAEDGAWISEEGRRILF